MLRTEVHLWKQEAGLTSWEPLVKGFDFLSDQELPSLERSASPAGVSRGGSAIWIHRECGGSLSLWAPEEYLCPCLITPRRRRTGGVRGSSGREWETGKQKGEDAAEPCFSPGCGCYYCSFHQPEEEAGTHAGLLSNTAETFMKSLQRQGRQALFLSPN